MARQASTPAVVLHLFLQTARLKKKRAVLTVASIAWGTVSVLLLLAFGQGFREQLIANEQGMGKNIAIIWPGQTTKAFAGMPPGAPPRVQGERIGIRAGANGRRRDGDRRGPEGTCAARVRPKDRQR
jgi:hypothetical protein